LVHPVIVGQILFLEYWMSMLIGCYYDRVNHLYAIFSLPYAFPEGFVTNTDIMNIQFNQLGYDVNCLIPMLLPKTRTVTVHIGENERLTSSFVTLLKQENRRGKLLLSFSIDIYFIQRRII
jgi:hypothetical protein